MKVHYTQRTINRIALPVLGLLALSGASLAATTVVIDGSTLNGGFESPTLGDSSKQGFDAVGKDIASWKNTNTTWAGTVGTYNDNGVDLNAGNAHSGNQFAFFHGGEGGAYNLSSYVLAAGDQVTVTWWGRADTIGFRLFSSTDSTYATAATLLETTQAQPGGYTQYSFNYTAVAADAGKTLGVSVFNPAVGYANIDDLNVTVVSVPEASASLSLLLGGTSFILRRSRRKQAR